MKQIFPLALENKSLGPKEHKAAIELVLQLKPSVQFGRCSQNWQIGLWLGCVVKTSGPDHGHSDETLLVLGWVVWSS